MALKKKLTNGGATEINIGGAAPRGSVPGFVNNVPVVMAPPAPVMPNGNQPVQMMFPAGSAPLPGNYPLPQDQQCVVGPVPVTPNTTPKIVSEGPVGTAISYEPGKDPNIAPKMGQTIANPQNSEIIVGAAAVGREQPKQMIRHNPGEVVFDTPVPGLKFDFNDGARIRLPKGEYQVNFIDMDRCATIFSVTASDILVMTTKKYFINFRLEVYKKDEKEPIWTHEYNARGKKVHIKCPTGVVLGDTLSWFPAAEEFRKKHGAEVYVTINPKMAEILKPGYPDIHFVPLTEEEDREGKRPADMPKDIYATYLLGVFFPCDDRDHQPMDFRMIGLHTNASMILGLDPYEEHPPKLLPSAKELKERTIKERYVCIAVNGSSQAKQWNNARGWIGVVKHLKDMGYRVLCIDKENFHQVGSYMNMIPFGSEDFTGDRPLQERIDLIYHADFFIGNSSGLSWMAWGVGRPVVLISGFTLPVCEFRTPYRVINYHVCNGCWNDTRITFDHSDGEWCPRHKNTERQFECTRNITPEHVNKVIDQLMADFKLEPPNKNKEPDVETSGVKTAVTDGKKEKTTTGGKENV